MSKVSIIVPIYKVEEFLPKCLDSLIGQTFKDIEIWAISDGSPDKKFGYCKEICKKDKRIKCVEKENGGWGSVIEYAINNIKTDTYIYLIRMIGFVRMQLRFYIMQQLVTK